MMEQLLESGHNQVVPLSGWQKVVVKRRKKERGYLLVELLIALTVVAILAAMAAPSILGLQMAANNSFAWNTVSNVYFTGKALAVCQAQGNSCPQLVMPSDGTWRQAGYTFTFNSTGSGGGGTGGGGGTRGGGTGGSTYNWTFTATPIVQGITGIHSYSASLSGIVQTN
jgi:prepilin-type N-terminal cleavage/methylation domain-containing protein